MDPHDGGGPHAKSNGQRPLSLPRDEELDDLADLFLGPGAGGATGESGSDAGERRAAALRVEGLVLGHLPVLAAAWPAQYARRRAEELCAPVALVRLAEGSASVEMYAGAGETLGEATGLPAGWAADWAAALGLARKLAGLAIVRVEESAEAELATLGCLDGLTLLSGADDAAVVACYRKLKSLAAVAAGTGAALPEVRLAIMGAERARAMLAQERIARAAREFLGAALLEPLIVERVGPTGGRAIFRGDTGGTLREVAAVLTGARGASGVRAGDAGHRAAPVRPALAPERPASPPVARAAGVAGRETLPVEGRVSLAPLAGDLAGLEARCPVAEGVELARDRAGRLHLVAARLTDHPELSSAEPVRDLVRAAAWARLNWALLVRAERSLDAGAAEPRLHLVSDRAEDARALAGTPVRVHVAVRAEARALGLATVCLED